MSGLNLRGARQAGRAPRLLSVLAGVSLLFMMAVITVSVLARYLFNSPITGVDEIIQLTAVCVVMLALPYATLQGAHVRVDIFDQLLGRWGRLIGDVLARVLSGIVLAILADRAWSKMLDAYEYEDTTNMLGLPIWPFYGILAAGIALCLMVYAVELFRIIVSGEKE
ncbi:TRAP-type C4-dicarboxylate transport system permease small subunit [Pseudorhizobium tarimense]|uniref:TRAP transporter small permease protein n=1 Tax=Pseudorhizobium tarimense TaxID=1079109 RepID=A0ABV2HBS6_9HYPH|nr:TRAP transporter small permease [Pseudorhizobium tarimense]MCJ8520901.1 TRAP transporter small permease [Pseudorhizobium tarimense]